MAGRILAEPQFDEIWYYSEDVAQVRIGERWGYLSRSGELTWDEQ